LPHGVAPSRAIRWQRDATERGRNSAIHAALVYGGAERFTRDGIDLMPWNAL